MATLVHDDVLDAAPLRRGLPTVVANAGRDRAVAAGDLLFSRAPSPTAARRPDRGPTTLGTDRQVELLAHASVALARGELAQRRDAYDTGVSVERYRLRCELKTAALFECACVIGPSGPDGGGGAADLRPGDRARLPAPRRRPRRRSARPSGPARRAAPTCSTAPSPCPSSSPATATRGCSSSTCARSAPAERGGDLRPDRRDGRPRGGPGRGARTGRRGEAGAARIRRRRRRAEDARARRRRRRRALQLERRGHGRPVAERNLRRLWTGRDRSSAAGPRRGSYRVSSSSGAACARNGGASRTSGGGWVRSLRGGSGRRRGRR